MAGNGNALSIMSKGLYLGLLSFVTAAPFVSSKTKAGRLLWLSFAMYLTLIVGVWAANLTAGLVPGKSCAKLVNCIKSVNDIITVDAENPPVKAAIWPGYIVMASRQGCNLARAYSFGLPSRLQSGPGI